MVSGRALYRQLAEASNKNARELLRNAYDLKAWGSRGHACSLAVLAIEESAKAFVYWVASEGVVRIVKKNPNYVTTHKESDLLDHEFKHLLITGDLYPAIKGTQIEELRKTAKKFRRLRARKPTKVASKKNGEDMA